MNMRRILTTPITLGTSSLGNSGDDISSGVLADAIIASPIGHVDTSNAYAGGNSERLLGAAIRRAGELPDGHAIYSKADKDPVTGAFDAARIRASIEESLTRLGLDRLPLYHLHDPQPSAVSHLMRHGGAVDELIALREEGIVGSIGIAAGPREMVLEYVLTDVFDAVLTHNRYTLADRSARPIIDAACSRGMTIFNAAPFGGGILANPERTTYGYGPVSPELATWLTALRELARSLDVNLAAAALQFSMRTPEVDSTVVGISSLHRLHQLSKLVATTVPDEFWSYLVELGDPPPSSTD